MINGGSLLERMEEKILGEGWRMKRFVCRTLATRLVAFWKASSTSDVKIRSDVFRRRRPASTCWNCQTTRRKAHCARNWDIPLRATPALNCPSLLCPVHSSGSGVSCALIHVLIQALCKPFTYLLHDLFISLRIGPFRLQACGYNLRF